ncbi:MAG: hypothetical protein V4608_00570 [Bacteroidota bacterium]
MSLNQQTIDHYSIKAQVRRALQSSSDPKAINLANNNAVLEAVAKQLAHINANMDTLANQTSNYLNSPNGQNATKAAKFLSGQVITSVQIAKNASNPVALSALAVKKILLIGGLVSENDKANCGFAVAILAAQGTATVAAGSLTFGVGGVLAGAGLLTQVYSTYGACRPLF